MFLVKKALVLAKIETQYGEDPTPAPADDAILVSAPDIRPTGEKLERESVRPVLSKLPHVIGKREVEISFSVEVKGSGTAATPPEVGALLRACGLDETIDTNVIYAPVSTGFESVTIYAYLDGIQHKILGCRGTFEILLEAGKIAMFSFTFRGIYQTPIDAAIPSGAVFDSTTPPAFLSGTFTYGTYEAIIQQLQLAMNNELSLRESVAEASGVKGVELTDRKPAGSMNPEAVIEATRAFWGNWESGAAAILQAIIGSAAGNKLTIDAPKCVKDSVAWGEREGMRIYEIPFSLCGDTGDDEIKLTYD